MKLETLRNKLVRTVYISGDNLIPSTLMKIRTGLRHFAAVNAAMFFYDLRYKFIVIQSGTHNQMPGYP